jgi:2',3'-cyclic-nucleotide 2'-phosphodiesterase (5'-nucleotidase family)
VINYHCNGTTPVIDLVQRAPAGSGGPLTPIGPGETIRIVTNDFMFTGGDGYTAFIGGTNVLQPGDGLLEIVVDYIKANSPVSAAGPPPPGVATRLIRT